MAQVCPCGCGLRIGYLKRGAAAGYLRSTYQADGLTNLGMFFANTRVREAEVSTKTISEIRLLHARAARLQIYLLEHCHGTAAPGRTPDLMQLSHDLIALEKAAAALVEQVQPQLRAAAQGGTDLQRS